MEHQWMLNSEGHIHIAIASKSIQLHEPFGALPCREDIQGLWPRRPKAFPVCLDWCQDRILAAELCLSLFCHYHHATLGYAISQQGERPGSSTNGCCRWENGSLHDPP